MWRQAVGLRERFCLIQIFDYTGPEICSSKHQHASLRMCGIFPSSISSTWKNMTMSKPGRQLILIILVFGCSFSPDTSGSTAQTLAATHLKLEGDQGQRVWCNTLQALDLKLWVVLAGIADLLGILKSANIATQRENLRILEVDAIVESVKGSLAEYIRAGTGQFAEALKLLFQQTEARPNAKSHVEIFCSSVHVTRLSPGHYRATYAVGDSNAALDMHPQSLNAAVEVIREVHELMVEDLEKRFHATSITKYFFIVDPAYNGREPPLAPALRAWSSHLGSSLNDLTTQFSLVLKLKAEHQAKFPETVSQKPHQFWPPFLSLHAVTVPEAAKLIANSILLSYENASVERDLSVLQSVCAAGGLGDYKKDHRLRVRVQAPPAQKLRGQRMKGIVPMIANAWLTVKRRRSTHQPKRGNQGSVPQRRPKRACGPNRHVPEANILEPLEDDRRVEQVPPLDLCPFLYETAGWDSCWLRCHCQIGNSVSMLATLHASRDPKSTTFVFGGHNGQGATEAAERLLLDSAGLAVVLDTGSLKSCHRPKKNLHRRFFSMRTAYAHLGR